MQIVNQSIFLFFVWYILKLWVILRYPPQKGGVRYSLVGNLLYQITFFSHLMVSSSHWAIPTLYVTVLFSHCAVSLLFFSHIWWFHHHIVWFQHHMWQLFCHIGWFPYFFLTLDGFILTLCSSNITCDSFFFSNLVVPLLFSHIWRFHPHIVQFQYHMWQFFCHICSSLTFFSHLTIPSSHCAVPTSHVTVFLSH